MAERFAYSTALLGEALDEQWCSAGRLYMRQIKLAMHGELNPRELDPDESDEWLSYGRTLERSMVDRGLPPIVTWLAMEEHVDREGKAIRLDAVLAFEPDEQELLRGTPKAGACPKSAIDDAHGDRPSSAERSALVEFDTETQRDFYETVKGWVQEIFGESATLVDDRPSFLLPIGNAGIVVLIQSVGETDACADFYSWPMDEVQVDGEMAHEMLRLNGMYRFGNLNLQSDGTVLVEYIALKGALDKATFKSLAYMVAAGSDEIGSELTR
jgi:hypothetical protein